MGTSSKLTLTRKGNEKMTTHRGRKGQWTLSSWLAAFVLLAAFGLPRAAHGAVCNGAFDILQKGFCSTTTNQGCDTAADCPAGETCKTFNFFDPGDTGGEVVTGEVRLAAGATLSKSGRGRSGASRPART